MGKSPAWQPLSQKQDLLRKLFMGWKRYLIYGCIAAGLCAAHPTAVAQDQTMSASFSEGLSAYKQKNFPRAVQLFEYCQKTEKPNPKVIYYCSLANLNNKNRSRGEQLLDYLVKSFPSSTEAKDAEETLSLLRAGSSTSASRSGSNTGKSQSSAYKPEDDPEFASLPQTAKLRFRHGEQGHMVVDAYLNGHPIKAMFDTGANTYLNTNALKSAGIAPPGRPPDTYARGWAGVAIPAWRMKMQITVGDLTRTQTVTFQQSSADGDAIMPLIGQDFINGYKYAIDEAGGWINLTKRGGESAAYNPAYDVPCVKRGKDDYVPLEINGKQVVAFIDTGASSTIIDDITFARLGLSMPSDAPYVGMSGVGGGFTCRQVEMDLKLGPIRKQNFRVLVGGTAGNGIGQDFMKGWRYTVDHDRNLLRFFH
jgi:predicted aspartyl protease